MKGFLSKMKGGSKADEGKPVAANPPPNPSVPPGTEATPRADVTLPRGSVKRLHVLTDVCTMTTVSLISCAHR